MHDHVTLPPSGPLPGRYYSTYVRVQSAIQSLVTVQN